MNYDNFLNLQDFPFSNLDLTFFVALIKLQFVTFFFICPYKYTYNFFYNILFCSKFAKERPKGGGARFVKGSKYGKGVI